MLFPAVSFGPFPLFEANSLLELWGHKMGPLKRGNQGAWCHALIHEGRPVALTTASYLSRLCAERSGLCRVALRLWREFVFPSLPFRYAMSYQDADLHSGNTYRFDGWRRVARSRSGPDTRSGRPGRDKWIWLYENKQKESP